MNQASWKCDRENIDNMPKAEKRAAVDEQMIVVLRFVFQTEIPRIIRKQRMMKLCKRWICSCDTAHSVPYSSVGMMTELKVKSFV